MSERNPVQKALWFIESHFREEVALDDVALVAGVTRFHLSRLFLVGMGCSVGRYVRGRRLAEAAKVLAAGAPDILAVAVDSGYGSHEAFTRAFKEQFGMTPEALRAAGNLDGIRLQEAIRMNESLLIELKAPRMADGPLMLIAGIGERYTAETSAAIPAQWQKFVPYLGSIQGQVGKATYGVLCNSDDEGNTDYISGVEVEDFSRIPKEFARLRIPEQKYAVFHHPGHVSEIRRTWVTIWHRGLPELGAKATGGPSFEKYGEAFDGRTGMGGFEIWIPVE